MDEKEFEKLQWLWNETDSNSVENKIVNAICSNGDVEALQWLWNETDNAGHLTKIVEAICSNGDVEALQWLWNETDSNSVENKIVNAICSNGDVEALQWLWNETDNAGHLKKITNAITNLKEKQGGTHDKSRKSSQRNYEYDCFICHASEDKESLVRDLVKKLQNKGYNIWYDEHTLTLGDSLRRKIDQGLSNSRFGVVILSKHFFEKEWPQKELDGLVAKEQHGNKIILPIWHGVTREDVTKFSPILASRLAASTHKGLDYIVSEIIKAINN